MLEFLTAFMHEAAGQPLATFLTLAGLAGVIWWFVRERPAQQQAREEALAQQHEDSLAVAAHIGCSNEVIRHSAAVIENSTKVIENSTKTQEMLQAAVQKLQVDVGELRNDLQANQCMTTEVLTIVRRK
jgi:uncharacterized protein HemX